MKKVYLIGLITIVALFFVGCMPVDEDSFLISPMVKGYEEALNDDTMTSEQIAGKYIYFEAGLTDTDKQEVYYELNSIRNSRQINPKENFETMDYTYEMDLGSYPDNIVKVGNVKLSYDYGVPELFTGVLSWETKEDTLSVYKVGEDWYIAYIYKDNTGTLKSYPVDFLQ